MSELGDSIAVIGLAGRFPGARDVGELWRNLEQAVESVTFFETEELRAAGLAAELLEHPDWVKAAALLEGCDLFDADFFGFSPREAALTDPQHRLFLECAWEALECACYDGRSYPGPVGVFAGSSLNSYALSNLLPRREVLESVGALQSILGSDKDFLATRVSYALDLHGPSLTLQTACSTSLVAVHYACQSLLNGECDLALAGGVSINVSQRLGFLHERGGIRSSDGHCRAFDARAEGGLGGSGLGIVVLKRLPEALADHDRIRAVIRGSAVNNDGARKAGYSAPSLSGQEEVVAEALAVAGVEPRSITYVECHGTGTPLGDPIELQALTRAFRRSTDARGFCAVGSVKTNIGHLDAAAGVAGLIKTILALEHRRIPPTLNFEHPNPRIDFDSSPFFVNVHLRDWESGPHPRRAGVTSLGMGGTNVHVVLEEAPDAEPCPPSPRACHLLVLSARSPAALEGGTTRLAAHLRQVPGLDLADVSYSLQVGRRRFDHRRFLVCRDGADAAAALELSDEPGRSGTLRSEEDDAGVAFLFPGQGTQYAGMGRDLLRCEPTFAQELRACAELLRPHLGVDLLAVIDPSPADEATAAEQLDQTWLAQPALFALEHSLARLWMSWGLRPEILVGHSIGEYVAACLSGVMSLEDAARLVARRGRLMQSASPGAMLAVSVAETDIASLLDEEVSLAAVNAPALCVIAGPGVRIDALEETLRQRGVECRRLRTSHAFHSSLMDPIVRRFEEEVARIALHPPEIPFLSNLTGAPIRAEEATDPGYWARHLRRPVRFSEAAASLLSEPGRPLVEVGPGGILGTLVRQQPEWSTMHTLVRSLRHPKEEQTDPEILLEALGQLWLAGCRIDWGGFWAEKRQRVPLPAYAFQRRRHWVEPPPEAAGPRLPSRQPAAFDALFTEEGPQAVAPAPPPQGRQRPAVVGPRDEIERELTEIWKELLGFERIGIHDNFFRLNGHSLMGVRLLSEIYRRWGLDLPHSILFRGGTIEHLARLVRTRTSSAARSPLVPIQADGSRPPFFSVHPASGNVLCYLELARRLGNDQPFYGLEAADVFRQEEIEADRGCFNLDIPVMASEYLASVRLAQPRGPYFLGGWSFGGIVAFEMAQQLRRAGEQVGLLALIDAPAPFPRPESFNFALVISGAAREIGRFFGRELLVPYHEIRDLDRAAQLDRVLEHARGANVLPPGYGLSQLRRFVSFIGESLEAVWRYEPKPYPGPITLFRAKDLAQENHLLSGHPDYADPTYGWSRLTPDPVDLCVVPGNHFTMPFPPHVEVLGRELRMSLERSRVGQPQGSALPATRDPAIIQSHEYKEANS